MSHEQMIETERWPVDLCVDCTYVNANGVDGSTSPDWEGWLPHLSTMLLGMAACGGDDVDDLYCEGHSVRPGTPCDGCGSTLGGYRWCHVAVQR